METALDAASVLVSSEDCLSVGQHWFREERRVPAPVSSSVSSCDPRSVGSRSRAQSQAWPSAVPGCCAVASAGLGVVACLLAVSLGSRTPLTSSRGQVFKEQI